MTLRLLLLVLSLLLVGGSCEGFSITWNPPQGKEGSSKAEPLATLRSLWDAIENNHIRHEVDAKAKEMESPPKKRAQPPGPCQLSFVECWEGAPWRVVLRDLTNGMVHISKLPATVKELEIVNSKLKQELTVKEIPPRMEKIIIKNVTFSGSKAEIVPSPNTLTEFICVGCGISELVLGDDNKLEVLNLDLNHLSRLPWGKLHNTLRELRLQGSPMTHSIDEIFAGLPNSVQTLVLPNCGLENSLEKLKSVPSSVRTLHISGNSFGVEVSRLLSVLERTGVTSLVARNCALSGELRYTSGSSIESLDVSLNSITSVAWAQLPLKLSLLNVSRNALVGTLPAKDIPRQMVSVDVSSNALTGGIDVRALPNVLALLDISQNRFSGPIDLTMLPESIRYVYIQHNAFQGSPNLVDLPVELRHILVHHNNWDSLIPPL